MYEAVFVTHILGAIFTGLVAAYAMVALWNRYTDRYSHTAIVLGAFAGFEVLTGTLLSVLSLRISAASLCGRIFLYLALVLIIEYMLFARMRKISLLFPVTKALAPVASSLALLIGALAFGF